jgi:imidazolonepropionase-like amidohydrolase
MMIIPTYALVEQAFAKDSKAPATLPRSLIEAAQAENIRKLKQARAVFLMGTDTQGPIFDEAEHLVRIGAFTTSEALHVVLGSGAHMFPDRRIGCFDNGCEADFLILSENPTTDVSNLRSIVSQVKAGKFLEAPVPSEQRAVPR